MNTDMPAPTVNPYFKTKILTASPAELRMLLFDGAIRFAQMGRDGLAAGDHEQAYNGITRCQSVLMELIDALDESVAESLCKKLKGLYVFLYTRLMNALVERDQTMADEVIELLKFERDTWRLLMDKLTDENRSAAASSEQAVEAAASAGAQRAGGFTAAGARDRSSHLSAGSLSLSG